MFSVITNIYNKKTKRPTLMEFFTATGKIKKLFLTTRNVPTHADACVGTFLVVKKSFLIFSVAVKNSIKVGRLVFLL